MVKIISSHNNILYNTKFALLLYFVGVKWMCFALPFVRNTVSSVGAFDIRFYWKY